MDRFGGSPNLDWSGVFVRGGGSLRAGAGGLWLPQGLHLVVFGGKGSSVGGGDGGGLPMFKGFLV